MKRGWLIQNGFYHSESFERLFLSLRREAEALGLSLCLKGNDSLCPFQPQELLERPDFVLFWDKDVRLADQLESAGLRVFNGARGIALCDDKTLTYLALKDRLPMPETILAPMTFFDYGEASFLSRVEETLSFPYLIKEGCGSFGRQVYLIHSHEEGLAKVRQLAGKPFLFQRFIRASAGRDLRVYVCGGKTVACMERVAPPGDFRSNIENGGKAVLHRLTKEEEALAVQAVQMLGLTFAGVDLLFTPEGPLLCEVNSNAHFSGLQALTGVNIPREILLSVLSSLT